MDTNIEPTTPPIDVVIDREEALLVLPERVEEERGIYRDEALLLVKELRSVGVDAAYLHGAEHREWHALRSEDVAIPLVLSFAVGVLSAASWDAIKAIFKQAYGTRRIVVRFHERQTKSTREAWFEASGRGDSVIDAIHEFLTERQDSDPTAPV